MIQPIGHSVLQADGSAVLNRLSIQLEKSSADRQITPTPIDGLTVYRAIETGMPMNCVYEPCIALIVQGEKSILFGQQDITCRPGTFFMTAIDVPTSAQITIASPTEPYLSLVLKLDLAMVSQMIEAEREQKIAEYHIEARGISVGTASPSLLDAILRLVTLLDSPEEIPVMSKLINHEICFRLLNGSAGDWLRSMVQNGYRPRGVIKALDWLKTNYMRPMQIEVLAELAGMGRSTLHHKFRDLTGTSPLQYQKSLRLYAARTLMMVERVDAGTAAINVGYESVSQFNREYGRMFGIAPGKDARRRLLQGQSRSGDEALHDQAF